MTLGPPWVLCIIWMAWSLSQIITWDLHFSVWWINNYLNIYFRDSVSVYSKDKNMNSFVYLTVGTMSGGVLGRSYFATTCSREVMDRSCICEYFTNDIISGLVRAEIIIFCLPFWKAKSGTESQNVSKFAWHHLWTNLGYKICWKFLIFFRLSLMRSGTTWAWSTTSSTRTQAKSVTTPRGRSAPASAASWTTARRCRTSGPRAASRTSRSTSTSKTLSAWNNCNIFCFWQLWMLFLLKFMLFEL